MKVTYGNTCHKCGEWFESETPNLEYCQKCEAMKEAKKMTGTFFKGDKKEDAE